MKYRSSRWLTGFVLGLILLVGSACTGYGNVGTVTRTIEASGARTASASFAIGNGEINIEGGADPLMHASFTTNNKRVPKVNYQVTDGVGAIAVTQSSRSSGFSIGPTTNHWAITLNDDVPLGLKINTQGAKATLKLDTLTVQSLDFSTDGGQATVGLNGVQNQLKTVSLRSTSGDLNLTMNGDYGNQADIEVDSSSGAVSANLDGKWEQKMTGRFLSDSGSVTIAVPKNVGVRVTTSTDSGYVDAAGFTSQGQSVYVINPDKPVMLNLTIQTSSGNITLRASS